MLKKVFRWLLFTSLGLVMFGSMLLLAYQKNIYEPNELGQEDIWITGGTLFSAQDELVQPNPGMVIRDGRITCIGEHCTVDENARKIDATDLTLLPGLIDLHVHFFAPTADNADMNIVRKIWNTARLRPDVRMRMHQFGITSIRSVGDPRDVILELKNMLINNELEGPRLYVAGPLFTAPGGHPTWNGKDPNPGGVGGLMTFQSNDPELIRSEITKLAVAGYDGIKAVFHVTTNNAGETLLPTLSEESLSTLINVAREQGLWVAVHTGPDQEVLTAARLGATTIEHGIRSGNLISQETLDTLLENNTIYVPTLGREPQGHLNIPALHQAGITIGVGTDTNNVDMQYGLSYHQELKRLVEAGMTPAGVLLAATRDAAHGIKQQDQLGTLEEGKLADIIIVRGTPWTDINDLLQVEFVIQDGRLVISNQ